MLFFHARIQVSNIIGLQTDKVIRETERKYEQKLEESEAESRQQVMRVKEEHAALVCKERVICSKTRYY